MLPAHAVASSVPDVLTIPDLWLTFAIGTVLPALVAFITARWASSALKAIALAGLSVLTGVLVSIQASGGEFDWRDTLVTAFMTFSAAVFMHFGLLKPIGVTGEDGVIARAVPGGLGRSQDAIPDLPRPPQGARHDPPIEGDVADRAYRDDAPPD